MANVFSRMPPDALTEKPMLFMSLFVPLGSIFTRYELYQNSDGALFHYVHLNPLINDNPICVRTNVDVEQLEADLQSIDDIISLAGLAGSHHFHSLVKDPSEFCVFARTTYNSHFITASGIQSLPDIKSLYQKLSVLLECYVNGYTP